MLLFLVNFPRRFFRHAVGYAPPMSASNQRPLPVGLYNDPTPGNNQYDPVLLFDKKSVDSRSQIELLTIPEVAELLKISASGVRRLYQERHLPFVKIGGSVRFLTSDIESYLKRQRVVSID